MFTSIFNCSALANFLMSSHFNFIRHSNKSLAVLRPRFCQHWWRSLGWPIDDQKAVYHGIFPTNGGLLNANNTHLVSSQSSTPINAHQSIQKSSSANGVAAKIENSGVRPITEQSGKCASLRWPMKGVDGTDTGGDWLRRFEKECHRRSDWKKTTQSNIWRGGEPVRLSVCLNLSYNRTFSPQIPFYETKIFLYIFFMTWRLIRFQNCCKYVINRNLYQLQWHKGHIGMKVLFCHIG